MCTLCVFKLYIFFTSELNFQLNKVYCIVLYPCTSVSYFCLSNYLTVQPPNNNIAIHLVLWSYKITWSFRDYLSEGN